MLLLYLAATLAVAIGVAHSFLGERYVIQRLGRLENLPRLTLGGRESMLPVLRFAWHITTMAWIGFAAILWLMAHRRLSHESAGAAISATFLVSAAVSGISSRGRHYSWIVFLAIGVIALWQVVG
ncbi:MAG: hypothetical protein DWQ36_20425 [Acidobacteria bacterium]|nr:MAG: hypothetical protein DWQ30_20850 [Acidobacteriota bacterium]REK03236.1 MAG: hypothetical protein DWQ36_20425 [Acidobacteriota bacterium]